MRKLRREAKRVGNQVTDAVKAVEPAIRHTIQKIDVKPEAQPAVAVPSVPPAYDAEMDRPDDMVEIHGSLPAANSLAGVQEEPSDLKAVTEKLFAIQQTAISLYEKKQAKYNQRLVKDGQAPSKEQNEKLQFLQQHVGSIVSVQKLVDNARASGASRIVSKAV